MSNHANRIATSTKAKVILAIIEFLYIAQLVTTLFTIEISHSPSVAITQDYALKLIQTMAYDGFVAALCMTSLILAVRRSPIADKVALITASYFGGTALNYVGRTLLRYGFGINNIIEIVILLPCMVVLLVILLRKEPGENPANPSHSLPEQP